MQSYLGLFVLLLGLWSSVFGCVTSDENIAVEDTYTLKQANTVELRATFYTGLFRLHRRFDFSHVWDPGEVPYRVLAAQVQIHFSEEQVSLTLGDKIIPFQLERGKWVAKIEEATEAGSLKAEFPYCRFSSGVNLYLEKQDAYGDEILLKTEHVKIFNPLAGDSCEPRLQRLAEEFEPYSESHYNEVPDLFYRVFLASTVVPLDLFPKLVILQLTLTQKAIRSAAAP